MTKFRTVYGERDEEQKAGVLFVDPSMTQQSAKDECDINELVKRAIATGDTAFFMDMRPREFVDCEIFSNYQDAVNQINEIQNEFNSLPASIRAEFNNDASEYIKFAADPNNIEECRSLGILSRETERDSLSPAGRDKPAAAPAVTNEGKTAQTTLDVTVPSDTSHSKNTK